MKLWSNNRSLDPTRNPWILNSASNNRCWVQQQTMESKILHPTTDAGIQQQILELEIYHPTTDDSASNNRCRVQQRTIEFKILHPTTDAGIQQQILEWEINHPTTDDGIQQQILQYVLIWIQQQILGSNNRSSSF